MAIEFITARNTDRLQSRLCHHGEVTLATEAHGDPLAPPMVLVMGAMASMLWWPDALVDALVEAGRYVIRYDHRDTGLSSFWEPGTASYTLDDMADDLFAVMNGYSLEQAEVVGMSLGGAIAQVAALRVPSRFTSLALLSSTPLGRRDLPRPTAELLAVMTEESAVDWSVRDSVVDFMVRSSAAMAGPSRSFDVGPARAFIARDYDRALSYASGNNHGKVVQSIADDARSATQIHVPTVIIHGTADPVFPLAHGEALASEIPDARLVRIPGGGHGHHPQDSRLIIDALLSAD
ncbi:MAG: alpha/beta fold hydrolase [Steroidobacteraceae bacterium]